MATTKTFTNGTKVQFTLTGGTQNGTWLTGKVLGYDSESDEYVIRDRQGSYHTRAACYVQAVTYVIRKSKTDEHYYIYRNGKKIEHTAYWGKEAAQIAVRELQASYCN